MKHGRTILLAALLVACDQANVSEPNIATDYADADVARESEFLRLAAGDPWANEPGSSNENPADEGTQCERVAEKFRDQAIALLSASPAVLIGASKAQELTGAVMPRTQEKLYLLRGFSSTNSTSRVEAIGNTVVVHSEALGGLFNLRRHPCVAGLRQAPSKVYTMADYDL